MNRYQNMGQIATTLKLFKSGESGLRDRGRPSSMVFTRLSVARASGPSARLTGSGLGIGLCKPQLLVTARHVHVRTATEGIL